MARLSGGELVVETLKKAGVDTVFGIVSVHNIPIYDAIERLGVAVVPSSGMDEDGALFWEARLAAKGVIHRRR